MDNTSTWISNGQKYEYNGFIYVPRFSDLGKPFKPLQVDKELIEIANLGFSARKKPMKLVDTYYANVNDSGKLEFIIEPHLKLTNGSIGPIIGVFIATREYLDDAIEELAYTCADVVSIHPDFWGNGVMKGGINVLKYFITQKGETLYLVLRTSDMDASKAYEKVFEFNNFGLWEHLKEYDCFGKLCSKDAKLKSEGGGGPRTESNYEKYALVFDNIFKHLQKKPKKLVPIR